MDNRPNTFQLLKPLMGPVRANIMLVCATILFGIGKFMLPLVIGYGGKVVIDSLADDQFGADQRMDALIMWSVISVAAVIAAGIATYFRSALGQKLSARIQHGLRRRLFFHLQRLGLDFFARHHAGALGARVGSDIAHVAMVIDRGLIIMVMDLATIAGIAAILVFTNWELTILAAIPMLFSSISVIYHAPRLRRQRKEIQESTSRLTGRAAETFAGIALVKASGGEQATGQAFSRESEHVRTLNVNASKLAGRFNGISLSLVMAGQLVVLAYGGYQAIHHPEVMTAGALVLFLMYLRWIEGSITRVVDGMLQLQDGMAALERIEDMMSQKVDPAPPEDGVTPTFKGSVQFEDVSFRYLGLGKTDNDSNEQAVIQVLDHFNLSFESGKTYALVGPSGGGKSSLFKLLLRFHDPQSGRVCLDGHDLRDIEQQHYRQSVAVVLQDPIMFSASIADNIGFAADECTQAQIERAARLAQAHEFILDLPDGYDTQLGERGANLSGGQRQRIALARTLMRDPRLLLLDEATSALDAVTEHAIKEVIDDLHGSRTIVIIAHRLATVKDVDEIIVVEQGQISERGTYNELLQNDGTFARMVAEQELVTRQAG